MLLLSPTKKNKINLEDYPYQRDIQNRIIMSKFSVFDVEVLDEILNSSLNFRLEELASNLDVSKKDLDVVLEKLEKTALFKREGTLFTVDKEMRKYYEFQIMKFDDDFKPDMEFIQALLKKVPIHALPIWYAIPRTSDNIFESLLDRIFNTPQKYERYLQELCFEDPILTGIVQDLYKEPSYKIQATILKERYDLSDEEFEYYMLHLEFNFVCYLSYNQIDGEWKEVVQPFSEWREYLRATKNKTRKLIDKVKDIEIPFKLTFSYVKQARSLIDYVLKKPLTLEDNHKENARFLTLDAVNALCDAFPASFLDWEGGSLQEKLFFFNLMIQKLEALRLIAVEGVQLVIGRDYPDWEEFNEEEFALHLYRHPGNRLLTVHIPKPWSNFRFYHEIERSLKGARAHEWMLFDDFLPGLEAAIGDATGVALVQKGKNWSYEFPRYSAEEKEFIFAIIFERLFEIGVVNKGIYNKKPCFCVTSFGYKAMGLED